MVSKEQERKALEQIKKIVEGLGEDSYIGKAFEGCFEKAAENIDNDFWCSMKDERDRLQTKLDNLEKEYKADMDRMIHLKEHLEKKVAEAETMNQNTFDRANRYAMEVKELQEIEKARDEAARKMQEVIEKQEAEKEQMAIEIMKLKARLYDMMVA